MGRGIVAAILAVVGLMSPVRSAAGGIDVATGTIPAFDPFVDGCHGGWMGVLAPGTGAADTLYGVAALTTTDVWAVGQSNDQGVTRTLAEHWNGMAWSIVPTPNPSPSNNALFGVAARSANDVWAVGIGGTEGVLVIHWDGATWSEVPTPSPGPYGGVLSDVAAVAENDLWAVGYAFGFFEGDTTVVIEHWDGASWSIVPSPSPSGKDALWAVSGNSSSDIWAVGHRYLGGGFPPLVEHWDGATWTLGPTPSSLAAATDVIAFGPADVWTGGWGSDTRPGFEHWDGTAWKGVHSPQVPGYGQIFALAGPGTDRLWAVGTQQRGVLVERWDGRSWRVVPAPSPHGSLPPELQDVAWIGPGPAWAVGTTEVNFGHPLIERTCSR
jgi:hypothetical protein